MYHHHRIVSPASTTVFLALTLLIVLLLSASSSSSIFAQNNNNDLPFQTSSPKTLINLPFPDPVAENRFLKYDERTIEPDTHVLLSGARNGEVYNASFDVAIQKGAVLEIRDCTMYALRLFTLSGTVVEGHIVVRNCTFSVLLMRGVRLGEGASIHIVDNNFTDPLVIQDEYFPPSITPKITSRRQFVEEYVSPSEYVDSYHFFRGDVGEHFIAGNFLAMFRLFLEPRYNFAEIDISRNSLRAEYDESWVRYPTGPGFTDKKASVTQPVPIVVQITGQQNFFDQDLIDNPERYNLISGTDKTIFPLAFPDNALISKIRINENKFQSKSADEFIWMNFDRVYNVKSLEISKNNISTAATVVDGAWNLYVYLCGLHNVERFIFEENFVFGVSSKSLEEGGFAPSLTTFDCWSATGMQLSNVQEISFSHNTLIGGGESLFRFALGGSIDSGSIDTVELATITNIGDFTISNNTFLFPEDAFPLGNLNKTLDYNVLGVAISRLRTNNINKISITENRLPNIHCGRGIDLGASWGAGTISKPLNASVEYARERLRNIHLINISSNLVMTSTTTVRSNQGQLDGCLDESIGISFGIGGGESTDVILIENNTVELFTGADPTGLRIVSEPLLVGGKDKIISVSRNFVRVLFLEERSAAGSSNNEEKRRATVAYGLNVRSSRIWLYKDGFNPNYYDSSSECWLRVEQNNITVEQQTGSFEAAALHLEKTGDGQNFHGRFLKNNLELISAQVSDPFINIATTLLISIGRFDNQSGVEFLIFRDNEIKMTRPKLCATEGCAMIRFSGGMATEVTSVSQGIFFENNILTYLSDESLQLPQDTPTGGHEVIFGMSVIGFDALKVGDTDGGLSIPPLYFAFQPTVKNFTLLQFTNNKVKMTTARCSAGFMSITNVGLFEMKKLVLEKNQIEINTFVSASNTLIENSFSTSSSSSSSSASKATLTNEITCRTTASFLTIQSLDIDVKLSAVTDFVLGLVPPELASVLKFLTPPIPISVLQLLGHEGFIDSIHLLENNFTVVVSSVHDNNSSSSSSSASDRILEVPFIYLDEANVTIGKSEFSQQPIIKDASSRRNFSGKILPSSPCSSSSSSSKHHLPGLKMTRNIFDVRKKSNSNSHYYFSTAKKLLVTSSKTRANAGSDEINICLDNQDFTSSSGLVGDSSSTDSIVTLKSPGSLNDDNFMGNRRRIFALGVVNSSRIDVNCSSSSSSSSLNEQEALQNFRSTCALVRDSSAPIDSGRPQERLHSTRIFIHESAGNISLHYPSSSSSSIKNIGLLVVDRPPLAVFSPLTALNSLLWIEKANISFKAYNDPLVSSQSSSSSSSLSFALALHVPFATMLHLDSVNLMIQQPTASSSSSFIIQYYNDDQANTGFPSSSSIFEGAYSPQTRFLKSLYDNNFLFNVSNLLLIGDQNALLSSSSSSSSMKLVNFDSEQLVKHQFYSSSAASYGKDFFKLAFSGCARFNTRENVIKEDENFYAPFLNSVGTVASSTSSLFVQSIFEGCPRTPTVSKSRTISEIPFCAPFQFVVVNKETKSSSSSDFYIEDVRGLTKTIKLMIVVDAHQPTPAPMKKRGRYIVGGGDEPQQVGLEQQIAVTHFNTVGDHKLNLTNEKDLFIPTESSTIATLSSHSSSTASQMILTTSVTFNADLDEQALSSALNYEFKINISSELLKCKLFRNSDPSHDADDEIKSWWAQATIKLEPKFFGSNLVSPNLLASSETAGDLTSILTLPASGPMAAVALSRLNSLHPIFISCSQSPETDKKLSFLESPFGMKSGDAWGKYSRGAVIGNIILLVLVASVQLAGAMFIVWKEQSRWMKEQEEERRKSYKNRNSRGGRSSSTSMTSSSTNNTKNINTTNSSSSLIASAFAEVQFPSLLMIPIMFLLQGTVSSGAAVMIRAAGGSTDTFLGVLSIGFYTIVTGGVIIVILYYLKKRRMIENGEIVFERTRDCDRFRMPRMKSSDFRTNMEELSQSCKKCAQVVQDYVESEERRNNLFIAKEDDHHPSLLSPSSRNQSRRGTRNKKFLKRDLIPRENIVATTSFLGKALGTIFYVDGFFIEQQQQQQQQSASSNESMKNPPFFFSRFGRAFSSVHDNALLFPIIHIIEGILIAIVTGYVRQSGECSQSVMLITSLFVVGIFITAVWMRPKRRSTGIAFVIMMQFFMLLMCTAGLLSYYAEHISKPAIDIFLFLMVIARYFSIIFCVIDLAFLWFIIVAPKIPLIKAKIVHKLYHSKSNNGDEEEDDDDNRRRRSLKDLFFSKKEQMKHNNNKKKNRAQFEEEEEGLPLHELMAREQSDLTTTMNNERSLLSPEDRQRLQFHQVEQMIAPRQAPINLKQKRKQRRDSTLWDMYPDRSLLLRRSQSQSQQQQRSQRRQQQQDFDQQYDELYRQANNTNNSNNRLFSPSSTSISSPPRQQATTRSSPSSVVFIPDNNNNIINRNTIISMASPAMSERTKNRNTKLIDQRKAIYSSNEYKPSFEEYLDADQSVTTSSPTSTIKNRRQQFPPRRSTTPRLDDVLISSPPTSSFPSPNRSTRSYPLDDNEEVLVGKFKREMTKYDLL